MVVSPNSGQYRSPYAIILIARTPEKVTTNFAKPSCGHKANGIEVPFLHCRVVPVHGDRSSSKGVLIDYVGLPY